MFFFLDSIVKDMTTDDVSKKEKALKEADDFLAKMTGKTGQMCKYQCRQAVNKQWTLILPYH